MNKVPKRELRRYFTDRTMLLVGPIEEGSSAQAEIEKSPLRKGRACLAYAEKMRDEPARGSDQQYASIIGTFWAVIE